MAAAPAAAEGDDPWTTMAAASEEPRVREVAMSLCALGRSRGVGGPADLDRRQRTPSQSRADPRPTTHEAARAAPPKKARPALNRSTSVPFDEMKRLMRVYGPLRCLRVRAPKEGSGKAAVAVKAESVRRKFYRWFPDLEERFVRTSGGWYKPKVGHDEEMRYREVMRKADQECLVRKRNERRSRGKPAGPRAAV